MYRLACALLLCTLLGTALPGAAQPNLGATTSNVAVPVQEKTDLSSPAAAIRSLAVALNRYDMAEAARCVIDGKPKGAAKLTEMIDEFRKIHGQILIGEPRIRLVGDAATASLPAKIVMQVAANNQGEQPSLERLLLRRIDGQWKVAGNRAAAFVDGNLPPADVPPGQEPGSGFFTFLASLLADPDLITKAKGDAQLAACQSNLKQLALAAIMMVQDFDEVFASGKAAQKVTAGTAPTKAPLVVLEVDWQKALWPYAKAVQVYFCPLRLEEKTGDTPDNANLQARRDKLTDDLGMPRVGEPYRLNPYLDNLNFADLSEPARTVLFYEGKDQKLDFRHGGTANVAYADGHVKAILPDEAKNLIWNPKEKQP